MTDIIIKSFNRPHYLDRCIKSILKNVTGNYRIKVVDDGTPQQYLERIVTKYPDISIARSDQYNSKIQAIDNNIKKGEKIDGFSIPTQLWINEVKKSSDYVLVTEDDVWVSAPFNIDEMVNEMKFHKIPLLRLGWLGNPNDDKYCDVKKLTPSVVSTIPQKMITGNKFFMNLFFYNRFKTFTMLYKMGLVDNNTKKKYWVINSILMGLYQKDYWLAIWKDAVGKVDEKQQLRNAATWYHNNKKTTFARTNIEHLKTTFKSSATGSYHEYGNNFDVNRMNFILNEAWYNDQFDPMENFPKDFSDDYIKRFLDQANHPNAQYQEWAKWSEKFKSQYRDLGAQVND